MEELEEIRKEQVEEEARLEQKASSSVSKRKRKVTDFEGVHLNLTEAVARKRRKETFEAAERIHGRNRRAASVGLIDTVLNRCNDQIFCDMMCSSKKSKKVTEKLYKKELQTYESSDENMRRSVAIYYSGGVMGKRKYRKLYRDSAFKNNCRNKQTARVTVANCPIPRFVSYNKLMQFIKSISIGTLYNVQDMLCEGTEKVSGCFRNTRELFISLAKFYLNKCSGYSLSWFGEETNTFHVALGGDGAPFGKDDTACSWLVSFLNIGRGVLSSNENFLIFGANCKEDALPVKRYINILLSDICSIEKEVFPITVNNEVIQVKFKISELPNDMKMLAFLSGELTNSSKYFSSFADVSNENANNINGTFGNDRTNLWKPWSYERRLQVVKKVEAAKKSLNSKKLAESTKRQKVTTLIGSLKSRQEFEPLLGRFIDIAHAEPLHLKNNACALVHKYFLEEVMKVSNLSNHVSFLQLPANSPLVIYINTLKYKCCLSRLANKVVKFFDESGPDAKAFSYRFTGKDSREFLKHFMLLVDCLEPLLENNTKSKFHFHVLALLALSLRDCVSLFSRVFISDEQVNDLSILCKQFFKLNVSFFNSSNPTVWTLGNIVPVHCKDMKSKYGMGLGLNSMEGRESKHVSIARYSINTSYQSRWQQIFMHEYVSLIWLREQGCNITKPVSTSGLTYVPKCTKDSANFCRCGLGKQPTVSMCKYCSHPFRNKIMSKIK